MSLELRGVSAGYGPRPVLRRISLTAASGELLALLGPSGCGKTTALKAIAGLLPIREGAIHLAGEAVDHIPAEKRGAAMVFQSPLLFPHMTVFDNIAFGPRMKRLPAGETARRVAGALEMVRMTGFEQRRPNQLSGGQQQRVALARALVTQPRVLLLDEPFSALDEHLREEMRGLVRALQRKLRITTVFVTHDQQEAAILADRVALLLDGEIAQTGAPRDLFESPRTARIAQFFGWQTFHADESGIHMLPPEIRGDGECMELEGTIEEVNYRGWTEVCAVRLSNGHRLRINASHVSLHGERAVIRVPRAAVSILPHHEPA
ncbi:MAG: ABC transporter ATP-binding protein [Bryobacterales bacterium]|nr:ABC transporter ATP-binding protein [Bryobacterales bacterium]